MPQYAGSSSSDDEETPAQNVDKQSSISEEHDDSDQIPVDVNAGPARFSEKSSEEQIIQ